MKILAPLFSALRPAPPQAEIEDPVLGVLRWDAHGKSWVSPPCPPIREYALSIGRLKKERIPPRECIDVARRLVLDPHALDRDLRLLKEQEWEKRSPALKSVLLSLRISSITFRSEGGRIQGELGLSSDPPQYGWSAWHLDGKICGIYMSD